MRSYSRAAPGTAVPYRHRDPAWLTPAQLEALAARDRRRGLLERPLRAGQKQHARRESRIAEYAGLRAAGLTREETAAQMGIGRRTARQYEAARKEAQ